VLGLSESARPTEITTPTSRSIASPSRSALRPKVQFRARHPLNRKLLRTRRLRRRPDPGAGQQPRPRPGASEATELPPPATRAAPGAVPKTSTRVGPPTMEHSDQPDRTHLAGQAGDSGTAVIHAVGFRHSRINVRAAVHMRRPPALGAPDVESAKPSQGRAGRAMAVRPRCRHIPLQRSPVSRPGT
jgi:hypothetical protein